MSARIFSKLAKVKKNRFCILVESGLTCCFAVKLLVAFFGAMFDVDHKAGILASSSALRKITEMKTFQPSSAIDILQKLCCLKDDFARQVATTRLAVYQLIGSLLTAAPVEKDIKQKQGPAYQFMLDLLQLCRSERDPDCLMVWFDILKSFMTKYEPSQEVLEEVYGAFKAYYPITLPRTAQSKVTPEELKAQLRACFSCHSGLSKHTFPFLVGKLDQGDGVTVNVKIDVLRTIRACIEDYDNPQENVIPYADRIWGSLKYEVRNGEIEDVIWATLEVLKTLTTRLKDNDLRDYVLTVTRDCVGDLSSAMYAAASGRLLVSVLSASPVAFVQMASPTVTHIKENLRHPKSISHSQDLFKIMSVVLKTRQMLMELHASAEAQKDFGAVDAVFKTLYHDVFASAVEKGSKESPSEEEIKVATAAVQGAGLMVSQRQASTASPLLSSESCTDICDALFSIPVHYYTATHANEPGLDELVNETTDALQKAVVAHPAGFTAMLAEFQGLVQSTLAKGSEATVDLIQGLGPLLAFVGCSELPSSTAYGTFQFLSLAGAFLRELSKAISDASEPSVWCALLAGLQNVFRYFSDALAKLEVDTAIAYNGAAGVGFDESEACAHVTTHFGSILGLSGSSNAVEYDIIKTDLPQTPAEAHKKYVDVSYRIIQTLYGQATTGGQILTLSSAFSGKDTVSEHEYLHMLGDFASFFVHGLTEKQQLELKLHQRMLDLFQPVASTPSVDAMAIETDWSWLINAPVNILLYGIVESARPAVITRVVRSFHLSFPFLRANFS